MADDSAVKAMKAAIVAFLRGRESTSFVELARGVPGFEGDLRLATRYENLFLWAGVSETAHKALAQLDRESKIHYRPTERTTYLIDGGMLNMPIAKRLAPYKGPHWFPVVVELTGE